KAVEESIRNFFLDQQTRACDARLPLIVKNRECASANCCINIGVVKDNIRALTAEFELHALQVSRRGLHNLAACHGRSGKCDLVHSWVLGKMTSRDMSEAGNDVDDAGRESNLAHQLSDSQRRERSNLR